MKRKAKRIAHRQSSESSIIHKKGASTYDGLGTSMPPNKDAILIYFDQKGEAQLADVFFNEHAARGWKTLTGGTINNWKVCAAEWIYNHRQDAKRRLRQSTFYSEL